MSAKVEAKVYKFATLTTDEYRALGPHEAYVLGLLRCLGHDWKEKRKHNPPKVVSWEALSDSLHEAFPALSARSYKRHLRSMHVAGLIDIDDAGHLVVRTDVSDSKDKVVRDDGQSCPTSRTRLSDSSDRSVRPSNAETLTAQGSEGDLATTMSNEEPRTALNSPDQGAAPRGMGSEGKGKGLTKDPIPNKEAGSCFLCSVHIPAGEGQRKPYGPLSDQWANHCLDEDACAGRKSQRDLDYQAETLLYEIFPTGGPKVSAWKREVEWPCLSPAERLDVVRAVVL